MYSSMFGLDENYVGNGNIVYIFAANPRLIRSKQASTRLHMEYYLSPMFQIVLHIKIRYRNNPMRSIGFI